MAHFNLYEKLGLDRDTSTEDLGKALDEHFSTADEKNAHLLDSARKVLTNPQRRAKYDAVLDDPSAADLTEQDVHDLASLDINGDDSAGTAHQNQTKERLEQGREKASAMAASAKGFATEQARETQEIFKKTDRKPIIITAVAAALATLLVVGLISLIAGLGDTKDEAEDLVEEFIDLTDTDEAQDWVRDKVPAPFREQVQGYLGLNDDYAGTDAFFGKDDLEVGLISPLRLDEHESAAFAGLTEMLEEKGFDEEEDVYLVTIDSRDKPVGAVTVIVGGDGARVIEVVNTDDTTYDVS